MAHMTARTAQLASTSVLAGTSVPRAGPFTSARPAPRSLVVRAEQGQNDVAMKTVGVIAAAQIALMPLAGAAMADTFPLAAVGNNPAAQFANKAKSAGNKAKAAVAPDPIDALAAKTKAATQDAKAIVNGAGVPDPVKDLQKKAKSASKKVGNPAAEFANKGKKVVNKAKPAVNKAKAKLPNNPAREFAQKAEKAKKKLPLGVIDYSGLQQNVLFGIGEKKAQKAVDKAGDAASSAADKAGDAADTAAKKVDENTPNSFSIFDANSVQDARQKLKANIDEAVNQKSDPAERVASVGKPGESQEENAERIRRESENNATPGGDARAPTN